MNTTQLNANFDQFASRWLGGRVDFDAAAGYQCVDVTKAFYNAYWACPNVSVGTAINMWNNTPAKYLEFMDKIKTTDVKKGDTVILFTNGHNGDYNYGAGHVGIANGQQDSANVTILEQNGSTGNGTGTKGDAIRYRSLPKARIAGILRPKVQNQTDDFMPREGDYIHLEYPPVQDRTTYKPTTDTKAGNIHVNAGDFDYKVRGFDSKYPYRIIINSASGGGNGVALALAYKDGKRIEGWYII